MGVEVWDVRESPNYYGHDRDKYHVPDRSGRSLPLHFDLPQLCPNQQEPCLKGHWT